MRLFDHVKPGDTVLVESTYGRGFAERVPCLVEAVRSGRIYVTPGRHTVWSGGTVFYVTTGRNCFHPKGQTRLLPPKESA